jgi:hypothetical protein
VSSTPAPWISDTPELLAGVLSHTATAQVVTAAGETVPLDLIEARVRFDETQSPRVQASLSCKIPGDVATLGRIDARTGARVTIAAGYVRPDGLTDLQPLVDLGLRSRDVSRPRNTMDLEAHSDEALLIDGSVTFGGTIDTGTTLDAIAAVIRQVFPGLPFVYTSLSNAGPAVNQSQTDTDRWDTVADLADRITAQVYDDGTRTWHVADVPTLGTVALTIADGDGGTLVESEAGLARDEWANYVALRYVWTDDSNVRHRVTSTRRVTSGAYAATTDNTKMFLDDRDTPTTQAQADAAATSLVKRMVTRGRSLRISTPSAYWIRPGDTITAKLPTGDPETCLVASVDFDLRTGLMDITTRLPDNTGTIGA